MLRSAGRDSFGYGGWVGNSPAMMLRRNSSQSRCTTWLARGRKPGFGLGVPDDARVPDRLGSELPLPGVPGCRGDVQLQGLTAGLSHCRALGRPGRRDEPTAPRNSTPTATGRRLTPVAFPSASRLSCRGKPGAAVDRRHVHHAAFSGLVVRKGGRTRTEGMVRPASANRRKAGENWAGNVRIRRAAGQCRLRQPKGVEEPSTGNCCELSGNARGVAQLGLKACPKWEDEDRAVPAPTPARRSNGATGQGPRCRPHDRPNVPALDGT